MRPEQERAAASLKRALTKVRDANLRVLVYSGAVHVCPEDIHPQDRQGDGVFEILEEHGRDCTPSGLLADGGAGN